MSELLSKWEIKEKVDDERNTRWLHCENIWGFKVSPPLYLCKKEYRNYYFSKIVILLETSNSQLEIYLHMHTYNIYYVCDYIHFFFFWKIVARWVDFPVPNEGFISQSV